MTISTTTTVPETQEYEFPTVFPVPSGWTEADSLRVVSTGVTWLAPVLRTRGFNTVLIRVDEVNEEDSTAGLTLVVRKDGVPSYEEPLTEGQILGMYIRFLDVLKNKRELKTTQDVASYFFILAHIFTTTTFKHTSMKDMSAVLSFTSCTLTTVEAADPDSHCAALKILAPYKDSSRVYRTILEPDQITDLHYCVDES